MSVPANIEMNAFRHAITSGLRQASAPANATEDGTVQFPSGDDLASRLRIAPEEGRIWLDQYRMIMLHAESFGALRAELINSLGIRQARMLLTRMGYASGARDAELARRIRADSNAVDVFSVGPQLHTLEGIVRVEPVDLRIDVPKGEYYGEFMWYDSMEDETHIRQFGVGAEPVCWMQIGYACGYTTAFMGRQILYREVECRGAGYDVCRIIGKPVADWDDPYPDLEYLEYSRIELREPVSSKEDPAHDPGHRASRPRVQISVSYTPVQLDSEDRIVGASTGYLSSRHKLERAAETDVTVLLLGESGVGKERFAELLHQKSPRRDGPFVALNCASLPCDLVEAELFGVERGAYTGAVETRPGRFERAHGGTLFLDEIGLLPMPAQAKLLRALQQGEVERVGGTRLIKVDIRMVAATNSDLQREVQGGNFRRDLFYRVNVFPVHIPPLRERRDDIPLLLGHFMHVLSARHRKNVTGITEQAMDLLQAYDFPGNIRELQNMVERAIILANDGDSLEIAHLASDNPRLRDLAVRMERSRSGNNSRAAPRDSEPGFAELALRDGLPFNEIQKAVLQAAVIKAGGNLSEAARALQMTRAQLAYRLGK